MRGICSSWATIDDLCAPCGGVYDIDESLMEQKMYDASELLYQLSAQQFPGICTETIKPCSRSQYLGLTGREWVGWTFVARSMGFFSACSCRSAARCSCTYLPAIDLPRDDVTQGLSVIVDGEELYPDAFDLRGNQLVRVDGEPLPCCDIEVTYEYGLAPPHSGVTAAAILACELYIACDPEAFPDAECRLPRNISSLSRQGVTVLFDRLNRLKGQPFQFGISEIDFFLAAFNPFGNTAMSTVISVDTVDLAQEIP